MFGFFFYHSSFNFRHSLLIIYHSSLKMPITLHEVCLASSLNICHGWPNLNIGNIPCCSNSLIKFQEFPMWKQITVEVRDFKLLVCKPNCKLYIYYWTIFRLPKFRIIRPCLDFFYHSSFNFRHSSLIIYHSSLKMPITLHEVCLASSLNIFQLFVCPITVIWCSFYSFFFFQPPLPKLIELS